MDEQAIHGLSCIRSAGRQSRHAAINDVVKRALSSAQIPAMLEPTGLSRSDSKRPDGVTIAPWKSGRTACLGRFLHGHIRFVPPGPGRDGSTSCCRTGRDEKEKRV